MTEIERKALALVNEVERQEGLSDLTPRIMRGLVMDEALCRAIEQHEAFRQEVSDAVEEYADRDTHAPITYLGRFIIAKPDPLVEALNDMKDGRAGPTTESYAACLRAAIEKRGGKIVWGEG